MRIVFAGIFSLMAAGSAFASGGLSCEADDAKAKFLIESGVTHGMGGPVFNFRGTIEALDKAVAEDLRKIEVSDKHLAQYWLDRDELRLLVYRERTEGDHGYIELTIRTKAVDEGSYEGRYELEVFDTRGDTSAEGKTVKAEGKVGCFAE